MTISFCGAATRLPRSICFTASRTSCNINCHSRLLMEAPTVRQLESRILHSRKTQSSLGATTNVIRINTAGQQRPLFSLCGRYGHAVRLLPVLHSLGPDQPCYALQPPAMDWTTVGCATIQQMAAHYIGEVKAVQPCGPYRLLGTSFGGLVAFEMALQLQRSGEQVEFLGMVDTYPPTCVFEDAIDVGNSSRLKVSSPPLGRTQLRPATSVLPSRTSALVANTCWTVVRTRAFSAANSRTFTARETRSSQGTTAGDCGSVSLAVFCSCRCPACTGRSIESRRAQLCKTCCVNASTGTRGLAAIPQRFSVGSTDLRMGRNRRPS